MGAPVSITRTGHTQAELRAVAARRNDVGKATRPLAITTVTKGTLRLDAAPRQGATAKRSGTKYTLRRGRDRRPGIAQSTGSLSEAQPSSDGSAALPGDRWPRYLPTRRMQPAPPRAAASFGNRATCVASFAPGRRTAGDLRLAGRIRGNGRFRSIRACLTC